MRQSSVKAHLFFSATHRGSRRWKHSCQLYTQADTLVSPPLSSSPLCLLDTDGFALLYLCTWPIHSISSNTLSSTQICTSQPIPFLWSSHSRAFSPPLLPNHSPVDLEVLKTISVPLPSSPHSYPSHRLSPAPVISTLNSHSHSFHSSPILVLSLPLKQPSASTQPLPIFLDTLFAISPWSSSSPSSYPSTLHPCLCLSSLYILSLRFAFSPSPAAWIYYYLHNGALLIVYELPALRPNKAYFHKKPPFHFSSN